jgi:hypothetical protein
MLKIIMIKHWMVGAGAAGGLVANLVKSLVTQVIAMM